VLGGEGLLYVRLQATEHEGTEDLVELTYQLLLTLAVLDV